MPTKFTVTLEVTLKYLEDGTPHSDPEPIGRRNAKHQIRGYVASAVRNWGGQYHPNDFLFSGNIKHVAVKSVK